jgi:3-methyl-2-oxobutanoate hydroxymethyltransferase
MSTEVTVPRIRAAKGSGERLVMLTAYDAPGARIAARGGVDLILVGDSMAMVVLGYDDTLQVDVADMAHHTAAVRRGLRDAEHQPLVVADLPWMSYHTGTADAVRNAATLIRAGAQAVKLEGGTKRTAVIEALVDAEIPVVGHLGLTPQSLHAFGGFKVQARALEGVRKLLDDARAITAAGCFAAVLEGLPAEVAALVTGAVEIPTIGIGAGIDCDGQVLVFHDLLGIEDRLAPRFVRRYAELGGDAVSAVNTWAADVRSRNFPGPAESYHLSAAVAAELAEAGATLGLPRRSEDDLAAWRAAGDAARAS